MAHGHDFEIQAVRYVVRQLKYRTDNRYVLYAMEPTEVLTGVWMNVCTRNLAVGTWQECMDTIPQIERQRAWR